MVGPGKQSNANPLRNHRLVFAEDDERIWNEEQVLSSGLQLSDESDNEHCPPTHGIERPNDLPSSSHSIVSTEGGERTLAKNTSLSSEFQLSNQSDSEVYTLSHDIGTTTISPEKSSATSIRRTVDDVLAIAARVEENHHIRDGLQDSLAEDMKKVLAGPEQHDSSKPDQNVSIPDQPASSNVSQDEQEILAEMMRDLGNQRVNELSLASDKNFDNANDNSMLTTKTKPAGTSSKLLLPVANHGGDIASDYNKLAQQKRSKYDATLDGLDVIGGDEYRSALAKQLVAMKDSEPSRRSDSFFAQKGEDTRKRGGSPLRASRGGFGGSKGSPLSRSDRRHCTSPPVGLRRHDPFGGLVDIPTLPLPADPKLAEALALARSMKFSLTEAKSSRGKSSPIRGRVRRSPDRARPTFALIKKGASPAQKTFRESRESLFAKTDHSKPQVRLPPTPKGPSARQKVSTMFDKSWLNNAASAMTSSRPMADTATQTSRQRAITGRSNDTNLVVHTASIPSLPCRQGFQHRLISLSPAKCSTSKGALCDLEELEDDLAWVVKHIDTPQAERHTSIQPIAAAETVGDSDSSPLMSFSSPARTLKPPPAFSLSRQPSHGNLSGFKMSSSSLMDLPFTMDEDLPGGGGWGPPPRASEDTAAAAIATDGRIRYDRSELKGMRYGTALDLVVSIVDNLPVDIRPFETKGGGHGSGLPAQQQEPALSAVNRTASLAVKVEVASEVNNRSGKGGLADSKWASPPKTISTAREKPAKKIAGIDGESGGVLGDLIKSKKLGGLADSKYASPTKPSEELASARVDTSLVARPTRAGRGILSPRGGRGGSSGRGGVVQRGRSNAVDENISPFPPRRRRRGGFGMDGVGDESPSPSSRPRRLLEESSLSKSPSRSGKEVGDQGEDTIDAVPPVAASNNRAALADVTHGRLGATSARRPLPELGQLVLRPDPMLPPQPPVFVPGMPQSLLLQGHAWVTGHLGESRRVRCAVKGVPWNDAETDAVQANIIFRDAFGVETEIVAALDGPPSDPSGLGWHAELFLAIANANGEVDVPDVPGQGLFVLPDIEPAPLHPAMQQYNNVQAWINRLPVADFTLEGHNRIGAPPNPMHPFPHHRFASLPPLMPENIRTHLALPPDRSRALRLPRELIMTPAQRAPVVVAPNAYSMPLPPMGSYPVQAIAENTMFAQTYENHFPGFLAANREVIGGRGLARLAAQIGPDFIFPRRGSAAIPIVEPEHYVAGRRRDAPVPKESVVCRPRSFAIPIVKPEDFASARRRSHSEDGKEKMRWRTDEVEDR